jgi:hypothetical protein
MKLTKFRLLKQLDKTGKQTRKRFKKGIKVLNHTNTAKEKKQFNLRNKTLKQWN